MDGDEAVVGLDVTLESGTLVIGGEGFVIAVGEDEGGVLAQIGVGEYVGRVGRVDAEVALSSHLFDGFDAGGDVVVDVALAVRGVVAGVHEHFSFRV